MATQLDLAITNRIIERETKNLERQNAALKATLAELDILDRAEAENPGGYSTALAKLRTKRDRQATNAEATKEYIQALQAQKARQTAGGESTVATDRRGRK